jgi:hypothetical protein
VASNECDGFSGGFTWSPMIFGFFSSSFSKDSKCVFSQVASNECKGFSGGFTSSPKIFGLFSSSFSADSK